jgi:hypothetical protein
MIEGVVAERGERSEPRLLKSSGGKREQKTTTPIHAPTVRNATARKRLAGA